MRPHQLWWAVQRPAQAKGVHPPQIGASYCMRYLWFARHKEHLVSELWVSSSVACHRRVCDRHSVNGGSRVREGNEPPRPPENGPSQPLTPYLYELIEAQFQTLFMLLREDIRHDHAGSRPLMASSGLLSHSSSCLLITHGTPLRNSRSDPENALYESRFHLIVIRYYCLSIYVLLY
jgi:hypothetical protein